MDGQTTGHAQIGPGSDPAARRRLFTLGSETWPSPTTALVEVNTSTPSPQARRQTCQHEYLDFIIIDGDPEMIVPSCRILCETGDSPHEKIQAQVMATA